MILNVESKDLNFSAKTVVEYWRNNVPPCVHMSDNEILESILRYALDDELSNIAHNVILKKESKM